jgi:hypothetical protein
LGSVAGILSAASSSALYQLNVGGTVTKATLTPVFSGATSTTYTGTPKVLSASTTPSTTVTLSYSGTGTTVYGPSSSAPSNAGSYDVSATISDSNYQGSANTTLTIGKASQTITFASLPNKTVGDPAFLLSASGGASAQPVTFSSSTPAVADVVGSQVTIRTTGTTTITANQAGNANYLAAPPVPQLLTINSAAPTFASTFPGRAANDTVGGVEALVAYALGGSPTGNNLTILPTSRYSGGTLQITFLARTNDPALTVAVEGGPDLLNLTSPVTKQNAVSQSGVPVGFERQIWTLNLPGKGFMRVKTTLNP